MLSMVAVASLLLLAYADDARMVRAAGDEADALHAPHAIVPAMMEDFRLPGTQPNTLLEPLVACADVMWITLA